MRLGTEGDQPTGSPLFRAAEPLLSPVDPNIDLKEVAAIIQRTKKPSQNNASPTTDTCVVVVNEDLPAAIPEQSLLDKIMAGGKAILPYPALASRFLTCAYRALPNEDAFVLAFQMPGLNRWSGSSNVGTVAIIVASFFALTDAIQTMIVSKDKVFDLCTHSNWFGRIKDFYRSIRAGSYPIPFLLLFALSAIPGSWNKADIGLKDMLQRFDAFSGTRLSSTAMYTIICPIAALSCFCSSVFLFQKSAWVVRAFNELQGNAAWDRFRVENQSWMRRINIIGASQATVGAFATGLGMFYNHHKFQFEVESLIFFLLVGVTSVVFNYLYCYNPVYLLESILEKQTIEAKKQHPQVAAQPSQRSCWSVFRNINGFFSVAGGAVMQAPSFVRALQGMLVGVTLATGKKGFQSASESPYFLVSTALVSLLFVWGAFVQGKAMWASPSEKKSREEAEQPTPRNALSPA